MNLERWQKVKALFDAAVELEPKRRGRFLDKSCGADHDLRADVERLLASSDEAESFMEQPAANEFASLILEPQPTLKQGERFAHYEIVRQIGAGGMGEVYLATDEKLDRNVAIKILSEKFGRRESNVQRFIREAKAASSLNHPNILVIHEISVGDGSSYIVSEYVEGKTLREVIRNANIKPLEILDIAIQISGALAAAHGEGIVHRDIKPENIVLRSDGYIKVLDFGLAKLVEKKVAGLEDSTAMKNQTAQGVILGTVSYMSPEQAKGEKVDERTDIFSLGVVIYELVTGKTPFFGNSMSETFANLINVEPPPLSRYASNVEDELQRIVSKSLRKNKDDRYQTTKDFFADLSDLRENLAFGARMGKSHSLNNENATAVVPATIGGVDNPTDGANYYFTGQISRHKSITALALAALLFGIIGLSYYFLFAKKSALDAKVKKTVAVLPFVNAGQDPNAEYLSDGITESVINNLSQIAGLRVMSRNSAFRFKNNQTETKNIAAQLGVETLVTGDIRQVGERLVINVRLINASDDSQIWGNQYVRTSADVFATQNEIAQAVAQNLRVKLSNVELQQLAKRPTENVEAWQLYQRGRFHVFKLTPPEIQAGISYFQQAIQIDPNYARAYVGLSEAYRALTLGAEALPSEFLPKSQAAARKAVELDDNLCEAHSALGAALFWEWNWSESETQLKRALELDPNSGDAHIFYAHLLSNTGRHAEAIAEAKRARELDPLFPFINALEAQFLLHSGETDEALARSQKSFELAPAFWMPHLFASSAYTEKQMYAEAISEARKAKELSPFQTSSVSFEGYALAKAGRRDEANALLNELLKLSSMRFVSPAQIAMIYNGLGETPQTLEWLQKGYEQHDPKLAFLKVEPKWNNLRSEPRFIDLMKRMKLD